MSSSNPPRLWKETLLKSAIAFILFTCILSIWHRQDPTAIFFNEALAHTPRYSLVREAEANAYISNVATSPPPSAASDKEEPPSLCLAVATVDREGARYFHTAVGSLLAGLDASERRRIHLILFFAHSDPSVHPAYGESWTHQVADAVLSYDQSQISHVIEMESAKGLFREKGIFDYKEMLKACHAVGAPYTLILEDDVLAMDGWFHRTMHAASVAEEKTAARGRSHFLYLRLFFTEKYFGWNSESWPTYLATSLLFFTSELTILLALRRTRYKSSKYLASPMLALYLFFLTPASILLFFAIGPLTFFPFSTGVIDMPQYGCCSQGQLFQKDVVPDIIDLYARRNYGFTDTIMEEYAESSDGLRWAMSPSVLQHKGVKSSKADGTTADAAFHPIFNFHFEGFDAQQLRLEHLKAVEERRY